MRLWLPKHLRSDNSGSNGGDRRLKLWTAVSTTLLGSGTLGAFVGHYYGAKKLELERAKTLVEIRKELRDGSEGRERTGEEKRLLAQVNRKLAEVVPDLTRREELIQQIDLESSTVSRAVRTDRAEDSEEGSLESVETESDSSDAERDKALGRDRIRQIAPQPNPSDPSPDPSVPAPDPTGPIDVPPATPGDADVRTVDYVDQDDIRHRILSIEMDPTSLGDRLKERRLPAEE